MSNEPNQDPSGQVDLIGYQLGILDDAQRAAVAARLSASPELQQALQALQADLRPLDAWRPGAPSPDLHASIMSRVRRAPRIVAAARGGTSRPELARGEAAPARENPTISFRELAGLAAAIALFVGVFVPGFNRSRMASQRLACADNLRNIGAGIGAYAEAYAGMLPYAQLPDGPWLASNGGARPVAPNSRHWFPLIKNNLVEARYFVCPGRPNDMAMPVEAVRRSSDFASVRNNSYSLQMIDQVRALAATPGAMPLQADQNPQFDDGIYHVRRDYNSDSHGPKAGQNVLRADGSAMWATTTTVGVSGDDIMTVAYDVRNYTGIERPRSNTDSFLIP